MNFVFSGCLAGCGARQGNLWLSSSRSPWRAQLGVNNVPLRALPGLGHQPQPGCASRVQSGACTDKDEELSPRTSCTPAGDKGWGCSSIPAHSSGSSGTSWESPRKDPPLAPLQCLPFPDGLPCSRNVFSISSCPALPGTCVTSCWCDTPVVELCACTALVTSAWV